jgi:hypothetical protein
MIGCEGNVRVCDGGGMDKIGLGMVGGAEAEFQI